jgi:signal transduction histidine kinase
MIAALRWLAGPGVSENPAVQLLLFAVLCGSIPLISGARRLAFGTVDRLLYREYLDHPNLNRKISVGTASAQEVDDLRTRGLEPLVGELRLSFAALLGVVEGRVAPKILVGHLPLEDAVSYVEVNTGSNPGSAALVTIRDRDGKHWLLCLGPKTSEETFSREDLDLAQSLAGHFATIMQKLELLQELQTKAGELRELNRRLTGTQEEERSRIASYLHDEPLQQISNLIWRHAGVDLAPQVQRELQGIAEDLRNFTARLQPGVLEDLGLVRALEWLGAEAAATGGSSSSSIPAPCNGTSDWSRRWNWRSTASPRRPWLIASVTPRQLRYGSASAAWKASSPL